MNRNKKAKNIKQNKNIQQIQSVSTFDSMNKSSDHITNTKYHQQG